MKALSNAMVSALLSSKTSSIGIMACTTRTGKALEARGLASPYYHLATDTIPHYQISAAGREHLATIERMESALRAEQPATVTVTPIDATPAETVALLQAISAEQERRAAVERFPVGARFINADGETVRVTESTDKAVTLIDELWSMRSVLRHESVAGLLRDGVWTRWEDPQTPNLGNVMMPSQH